MSWITDAQHQAEELHRKEQEKQNLAIQERNRRIQLFHQTVETTRIEIENLFSTARTQGLKISVAGTVPEAKTNGCGNFLQIIEYWPGDARSPNANPYTKIISVYAIGWTIIEPKSGNKIDVFLGADCNRTNNTETMNPVIGIRGFDKPSIKTVAELETEIKNWLVYISLQSKHTNPD